MSHKDWIRDVTWDDVHDALAPEPDDDTTPDDPQPDRMWSVGPGWDPEEGEPQPWSANVFHWPAWAEDPSIVPEHWTWELIAPDGAVPIDGHAQADPSSLLDSIVSGLAAGSTGVPEPLQPAPARYEGGHEHTDRCRSLGCPCFGDGFNAAADVQPPTADQVLAHERADGVFEEWNTTLQSWLRVSGFEAVAICDAITESGIDLDTSQPGLRLVSGEPESGT